MNKEQVNLEIKLNLLCLENSCIITLNGKTAQKRGVFIPINDNDIFVSKDKDTGKAKAAYLNFTAWERKEVSQFGATHALKQSYTKEFKERLGEEAIKARPYLGDGKLSDWKPENQASNVEAPAVPFEETDDLPF